MAANTGLTALGTAAPGGGTPLAREEIVEVRGLRVFDIRNGDASEATSMLIRPTIHTGYHWVTIGGINPDSAIHSLDVFIKCALYQLTAHNPDNWSANRIRKNAIVLGTARAVATSYYRLGDNDYIAGEVKGPYINKTGGTDDDPTFTVLLAAAVPHRACLTENLALTSIERAAITAIVGCSVAALPLQGYSLMMTGHHYISEVASQSRKAYAVVEKQFWKSTSVKPFFETDTEDVQDTLWHKAGHPVSLTVKEALACDNRVAEMLRTAGCGAGAARLPALEPTLRTAGSYLTLMQTVGPLFELVKGKMDTGDLPLIVDMIKGWPRNGVYTHAGDLVPASITTRAQALAWLGDVLSRNAPKVAYCYGFYCALSDHSAMLGGGGPPDTLKTSFSLSRLRSQSVATYVEGSMAHADYAAARAQRRQAGLFVGPSYVFDTRIETLGG